MSDATAPAVRAEIAAAAVGPFVRPVLGIPGTLLARTSRPSQGLLEVPWNYWWQAHVLDAIVDAGLRHADAEDMAAAERWLHDGQRFIRGVLVRNGLRYGNRYYDDMAWLALACQRFEALQARLGHPTWAVLTRGRAVWRRQFQIALANPWGGTWWNKNHDFANAPAAAPIGLWHARCGQVDVAERLALWLTTDLKDHATGLILDGMREQDGEVTVENAIYTYNQGTTLGLALALGGPWLAEAEDLVAAVAQHLTVAPGVLQTHGTGDGGLFTGILVRYLAEAARDARLDAGTRRQAADLVRGTADAIWAGRHRDVFPVSTQESSSATEHGRIGLPQQVQAWTIFEAATRLEQTV